MAKILVCTDSLEDQEVLCGELAAARHEVILAADGVDALKAVVEDAPHMVFLAESMPVFNAYEACRMMRDDPDVPDNLPIILLAQDAPDPRDLDSAGFSGYFLARSGAIDLRSLLVDHLGPLANTWF